MVHEYDVQGTYKDELKDVNRHFLILDSYGVSFSYDRQHEGRHPICYCYLLLLLLILLLLLLLFIIVVSIEHNDFKRIFICLFVCLLEIVVVDIRDHCCNYTWLID